MAPCSAVTNRGSSPCPPPSGGGAWLRSRRKRRFDTACAPRPDNARSGRRNRRFNRTKEQPRTAVGLAVTITRPIHSFAQWWVRLNCAPHTEIRTSPVLVHLEHGDLVLAEHLAQLVVSQDLAAVLWVLQVVRLDVVPNLAHHLAA